MTILNRNKKATLREAINRVTGDGWTDLIQIAICLRFLQLQERVLHPDDSCSWSAEGSDEAMHELGSVLLGLGLMQLVDHSARQLMAEVRFARATLQDVVRAESDWGQNLATLESWTDAAQSLRANTEVEA